MTISASTATTSARPFPMPPKAVLPILCATLSAAGLSLHAFAAEDKVDFSKEIKPILESSCVQCHGPEKQKGKLRLDSREAWLKGGENGAVFKAGHSEDSDFVQRVTLAEDQDDVMPPKGKADHLSQAQMELVKRWITEGGEWPEGVVAVAMKKSPTSRQQTELVGPPPSAEELQAVDALARRGIKVRPIAAGMNWRRADLRGVADKVSPEDFATLARILSIQELNLGGVPLRDEELASLAFLMNLTILHLENTPITDAGLAHLGKLEKLGYLNLFGTAITDTGLKSLTGLNHLRWLYLAGTKVTGAGVKDLRQQLPNVLIDAGSEFAEIATKDPEPPNKPTPPPSPTKAPAAKP